MAILSAPSCSSISPGPNSGWALTGTPSACVVRTKIRWSRSKANGWGVSFPTSILGNLSLFQMNGGLFGGLSQAYKNLSSADKSNQTSFGATYPFTNIDGTSTTHTGMEFFMHMNKTKQLVLNYNAVAFGQNVRPFPATASAIAHDEADAPIPIINDAHIYSDGSWTIGVSNWPAGLGFNDYYAIYMTGLYRKKTPPRASIQMSAITYNGFDPPPWSSGDPYAVAGPLIRPLPAGRHLLMGIRTFTTDPSIMPSPIAWTTVYVEP